MTLQHLHFPNESADYRRARNALLDEEMALRRQVERVAEQRRALPKGGEVPEDYVFEGLDAHGRPARLKMSELFAAGKDTLAIYSFMFGPERDAPCPGCTHFLDSLDGVARHAGERLSLIVVAKSPLSRLLDWANKRGWQHLRLLSTAGNNYDRNYFGDSTALEPAMREQQEFGPGEEWDMPILNVFHRDGATIRHFWGCELLYVPPEPGQEYRHNDLIDPLWNLLDTTPEGRGDFHPRLGYAKEGAPMSENQNVKIVRTLKASPRRVWQVWTAPGEMKRWASPGDMETIASDGELKVGGKWHALMRDKAGKEHKLGGFYQEIVDGRKLVFTWCYGEEPDSRVTVLIEPAGAGTRLTLIHDRLASADEAEGVQVGWSGALDKLERQLRAEGARRGSAVT